ncbi:hypothetical protein ACTGU3_10580, partial [Streptococcus suis]
MPIFILSVLSSLPKARLSKNKIFIVFRFSSVTDKTTQNKKDTREVNRTPKVRQKKSNIWGAIFMKLSYEDKIEIYELRQSGQSIKN